MDVKIRSDRARRRGRRRFLHQVHRGGPVAVTIEERAADAAVENSFERLVIWLGFPFTNQLVALLETADAQALVVRRTASEAEIVGRVGFLNAFHFRENATTSGKNAWKCRSSSSR